MPKIFLFFLSVLLCCGCASVASQSSPPVVQPSNPKPIDTVATVPASKPEVKPVVADGIIFGKADFRGVLKVEYVKLMITDKNNPDKGYELFFGNPDEEQLLPWQSSNVEPNYFFLELPAGKYTITSISIPVGTTLATEKTDISFIVEKETVIYLGTLRVTGTDQKIRFGVVPLVKPGFDYKVDIFNEQEEALGKFKARYPSAKRDIQVNLMQHTHIQAY